MHSSTLAPRPRVLSIHASVAVGGSGKSWMLLLRALRPHFEVFTSAPRPFPCSELDQSKEFPVDCPQISRRFLGNLLYFLTFPYFVAVYCRLILTNGINLVHVNSFYLLQPMVAAMLTRTPLLTHVREAQPKYPPHLYSTWVALASALSDRLIFCSRRDMLQFARKDLVYLPNWISLSDVDRDLADRSECDRLIPPGDRDSPMLLVVSQLISDKGHDFALEVFAEVHKRNPAVRLLIAGGTNNNPNNIRYSERLKARYEALGLSGKVTFLGEVRNVCSVMRRSQFVLMPSPAESFSRVHLEAMASGAVIVATDAGSTGDLVDDAVDGIIIRYGDATGAAERIAMAISDPANSERMGRAARSKIATGYVDTVWAPVLVAMFRSALPQST